MRASMDRYTSRPSTGRDLRLPRDTFLGMRWNEGRYRKQNAFVEVDHYLDDNWNLNVKVDYRRTFSVQEYASLAGSGSLGGGVSADGLLPLDGIQRYDHAGNQLTFQANGGAKDEAQDDLALQISSALSAAMHKLLKVLTRAVTQLA